MIPRFDASEFNGITPEMRDAFERDGVLVLDGLVSAEMCALLQNRMNEMVKGFDAREHRSVFSSTSEAHAQDQYFLESGHEIRFFMEEEAFGADGQLTKPLHLALNKVGHAMHDLDETFSQFARQDRFRLICRGLGQKKPLPLQSMYIFKQPHIGGEVVCHQDATYLRTEPESCLGLWVAIEDATTENGCLWGIPGGHKTGGIREAFRRAQDGDGTYTERLDDTPFEEDKKVPLEAPKGTVLVFGGKFPHMSSANRSDKSRHAYTLHVIDGSAHYPADNWLRRPPRLPLKAL
ncbi:phytanoyl-CoA dioxygenase family protein [Kordiimonas sp.]|uniref:phytanoyl-CoA dioxygenase family protein n=1 Tax=Kordiimonas sp. TaxID=1970157 RepID=UPI003A8E3B98